jgi:hypothetical protein
MILIHFIQTKLHNIQHRTQLRASVGSGLLFTFPAPSVAEKTFPFGLNFSIILEFELLHPPMVMLNLLTTICSTLSPMP